MKDKVKEHMEVIGADGGRVGTVDRVERHRLRLKKDGSFAHQEGHHRYIAFEFVAGVEGDKVRLTKNAKDAVTVEEDKSGHQVRR